MQLSSFLEVGGLTPATQSGILDATARDSFQQDADSWSVFAEGTYHVSDSFRITAGLRYSEDEKDMSKSSTVAILTTGCRRMAMQIKVKDTPPYQSRLCRSYKNALNLAAAHATRASAKRTMSLAMLISSGT